MHVLLVEDDDLMVDLITVLLGNAFPGTTVTAASSVTAAWEQWHAAGTLDLVICDWRLDGFRTGDELISMIRRENSAIPIMMLTGHKDRQLVRRLGRLGVNEYILKPFEHQDLIDRVRHLTGEPSDAPELDVGQPQQTLDEWLADVDHVLETVPNLVTPVPEIKNIEQAKASSAAELAYVWRHNSGLLERVIRSANRMLQARSGTSVSSLRDAMTVLGTERTVDLVLALAVGQREAYPSAVLARCAEQLDEESTRVAHVATQLAHQANVEPRLAFTAGILHNLGDKAVLAALCHFAEHHGTVEEADIAKALSGRAATYGNRLKVKWHLPIELRSLMGGAYALPRDHATRQQLVMRLARSLVVGGIPDDQLQRWARQAGVDTTLLPIVQ